jgi:CPA1 family monovalent cation:H+ antiporter
MSALSLFVLIALSTVIFFTSRRFKLPYTVMLVLVGLLLVPIVNLPYFENIFGFLDDLVLTPELLFYIFLPVLIFESGFNMSIRKMLDSAWVISLMAVVSLIISTVTIALGLYYLLPLIGFPIPFIIALLFGAIISPTDPVAVLSLFKECGVPRRLGMIFEGESLLNDGTAMALFLVLLSIATFGFHGTETVISGITNFTVMIIAGIGIGLVMAAAFSKALHFTKKNEFVTVTLLLISAHMVFIVTELINQSGYIHVSSIIATTVAALFLGNYTRSILAPKVDEYLSKLIEHMAFVINSLVFLMAGLLFASSGVNFEELWLPIVITVLIVALARIIAIYAVVRPLNYLKIESHIPSSWQKLLAWGSLRGALSIIIVLLIPVDFTIEGWSYSHSPRDFLLALTIGCILATLFIKAPMIIPIMRRYKIIEVDPLKVAHQADLGVYYLLTERARLLSYKTKGFLGEQQYSQQVKKVECRLAEAETHRDSLVKEHGSSLFDRSLHLAMVHVEKTAVKRLFINEEVSERTYRKIYSKLCLQQEKIELALHDHIDPKAYTDRKDVFDRLVAMVQYPFEDPQSAATPQQRLEYYRAQMIMARKAVQTIEKMQTEFDRPVFLQKSYEEVLCRYRRYKERSAIKADELVAAHQDELTPYLTKLAERSLAASGARAMTYLHENGLVDEATEEEIVHTYAAVDSETAPSHSA